MNAQEAPAETRRIYVVDHPSGSGFMIAVNWSPRSGSAVPTVVRSELLKPCYATIEEARHAAAGNFDIDPKSVIVIAKGR